MESRALICLKFSLFTVAVVNIKISHNSAKMATQASKA
jgi:hypothetical protein